MFTNFTTTIIVISKILIKRINVDKYIVEYSVTKCVLFFITYGHILGIDVVIHTSGISTMIEALIITDGSGAFGDIDTK